jgi:hypothetical protein
MVTPPAAAMSRWNTSAQHGCEQYHLAFFSAYFGSFAMTFARSLASISAKVS